MAPVRFAINHLFGVRAAVFGLLVACAMASSLSAGRRPPDWVKGGKVDKYPAHVYVTGVGVGSDLDAARTNARAEVSKVFQARIRQTSQDILSEVSAAGSVQGRRESEMSTSVSTDGLLEGVRIAETWYDKKSKKHYALAVLNKAKARAGFSEQIADKEAESRSHLAQGQKAAEPLEKARHYARARAAWRDRDALITRRRVVDPANADFLANPASAEIDAALNEALHSIQFVVEAVSEDPASRLKEAVTEKITLLGFRVADSTPPAESSSPVFVARCRLTLEPFDRGNPSWKFYRWNGSFQFLDARGAVLTSAAPAGSEGHLSEETARAKARIVGEQTVAEEARKLIARYIFEE
jgi:hypothetical protein